MIFLLVFRNESNEIRSIIAIKSTVGKGQIKYLKRIIMTEIATFLKLKVLVCKCVLFESFYGNLC
jgi:hypothetical protein